MGSLVHNSLLNSSASRLKAAVNDIVLSINDVRLMNHAKTTDLLSLTPRAVTNMVDCTGLQEFQTRRHCDDDPADNGPNIMQMSVTVSKGIRVRNQTV